MKKFNPIKTDVRICFAIEFFDTEEEASRYHDHVRKEGWTYNGGFFDGKPCGREERFDHFDAELGKQLYAVTC